jgi:hypothetical protein
MATIKKKEIIYQTVLVVGLGKNMFADGTQSMGLAQNVAGSFRKFLGSY